jgi:hypothetical protein
MLSLLFFPYLNQSVRILWFNNSITVKLLYLYNPYLYSLLYRNRKTIDNTVSEKKEKPEKKLNAYQVFIKENYNKIKNENPFLTSKEIMVELGREWSENKKKSF